MANKEEKTETKKDPKNLMIIVGLIGVIIILASMLYNKENKYEDWVVCDYVGELESMEETIKFRYMFNQMYGYYEYRTVTIENEDNYKEALEQVNNFGKDFKQSDELSYKVEEEQPVIKTTFYIKALSYKSFMDKYLEETGISVQSSKEEVIEKLGTDYQCKIVS